MSSMSYFYRQITQNYGHYKIIIMSPMSPNIWIFKMTNFCQNDAHDRQEAFLAHKDQNYSCCLWNFVKNTHFELLRGCSWVAHDCEHHSWASLTKITKMAQSGHKQGIARD